MLATVSSSTSANRIKRRINEFGVFSSVVQTPQSLAKDGCGYSLRFDDSAKPIVVRAAHELGIRIRAFYIESVSGDEKIYSKM